MNKGGVWKIMKKSKISADCRCVKCMWIVKIKKNGIFCKISACRYSQIPGVDFSENYSPVVHNVTCRLLLVLKIIHGFSAKIADVETAFIWGDSEEEIFMDCPK